MCEHRGSTYSEANRVWTAEFSPETSSIPKALNTISWDHHLTWVGQSKQYLTNNQLFMVNSHFPPVLVGVPKKHRPGPAAPAHRQAFQLARHECSWRRLADKHLATQWIASRWFEDPKKHMPNKYSLMVDVPLWPCGFLWPEWSIAWSKDSNISEPFGVIKVEIELLDVGWKQLCKYPLIRCGRLWDSGNMISQNSMQSQIEGYPSVVKHGLL